MTAERIVKTVPFNDLAEPVQEKVCITFRGWLMEVYKIFVTKKQIGEMFYELNTLIEFFVLTENGETKKLFRVDDSDERLARFLAHQFAIISAYDQGVKDKILMSMIKRNDGAARLKFRKDD